MTERTERNKRHRGSRLSVVARIIGGGLLAAVLVLMAGSIDGFGIAVLYAATWTIVLHVAIGEYVFIRHLHALSRNQQALDALAFVLLLCALLSIGSPPVWCAFFAGVFALAIVKYLLIESRTHEASLKRYAREKVRWESPAVLLFSALAVLFNYLPARHPAAHAAALAIFAAAAGFAFWMIGIRHIYRSVPPRSSDR